LTATFTISEQKLFTGECNLSHFVTTSYLLYVFMYINIITIITYGSTGEIECTPKAAHPLSCS
jgi:hypothetical protein